MTARDKTLLALKADLDWSAACLRAALESQSRLVATIERVRLLPTKWRREGNATYEIEDVTLGVCADELERALAPTKQ